MESEASGQLLRRCRKSALLWAETRTFWKKMRNDWLLTKAFLKQFSLALHLYIKKNCWSWFSQFPPKKQVINTASEVTPHSTLAKFVRPWLKDLPTLLAACTHRWTSKGTRLHASHPLEPFLWDAQMGPRPTEGVALDTLPERMRTTCWVEAFHVKGDSHLV